MYENTAAKFFPLGEDMFEQLMEELKAAKHFIFMEYFIIDRGYMWDSILVGGKHWFDWGKHLAPDAHIFQFLGIMIRKEHKTAHTIIHDTYFYSLCRLLP